MPCLLLDHQGQRDAFLDLILGESLQTGKADGVALRLLCALHCFDCLARITLLESRYAFILA